MVGEVVRDQAEPVGDLRELEEVSPLAAVTAGSVLEQNGDTLAGFLKIDPVIVSLEVEMHITADGRIEAAGRALIVGERRTVRRFGAQQFDRPHGGRIVLRMRQGIAFQRESLSSRDVGHRVVIEAFRARLENSFPDTRLAAESDDARSRIRNAASENAVLQAQTDLVASGTESQAASPIALCELELTVARATACPFI